MISRHDIEQQAARFIEQRSLGPWSPGDQNDLTTWLTTSAHHRVAYLRLNSSWQRSSRLKALHPQPVTLPLKPKARPESRFIPRLSRSAALILFSALIGAGAFHFVSRDTSTIVSTGVGGHKVLTLEDGSTVELNTDTVLRITSQKRSAILEKGEAYFRIKHDDTQPFIVTAAGYRVIDLGTEFLVKTDKDSLHVALIEGQAQVASITPKESDSAEKPRTALLNPGDMLRATQKDMHLAKASPADISRILGWQRGMLIFDNVTLAKAAAEFNRYNTHKIIVAESAADLKIAGSFPVTGVKAFSDLTHHVLSLKVQQQNGETRISK